LNDPGASMPRFFPSRSTGLEEEFRKEKEEERIRRERFPDRFPRIASLPVINRAFAAMYGHGFPYILLLLLSIVVFTAIKAPYFAAPFTGQHSMKYNTYVEPAMYMDQKGTMLWNQKKYVSDPVHNPEGIFMKFDRLPLMEWGLYLTYKLFPNAGLEAKTRIFTHTIGILILLSAYRFFCGYFPKRFTVLFIGLFSINPVFSFSTHITVLDSIVLVFMFLSLRQITVSFEQNRIANLWLAAIWFGLGNAVKYPLFLWLAPITFLFMYKESGNAVSFLKNYVLYLFLSLLVTFTTVVIVGNLISSPKIATMSAALLVATLMVIRYFLVKYEKSVDRLFEIVWGKKKILVLVSGISIVAGIFIIKLLRLDDFSNEFLTDSTLVADYRLYKYMLFNQFKNYMTRNMFWFGLFGTALAFVTREKPMRRVWVPFIFGSIVYWVVASKAIFFHIYYSLIIVLTLTMSAAYIMHFIIGNLGSRLHKSILLLFFLSLVFPPILDATNGRMKNYFDVGDAIQYIQQNTKPDEFILFEGFLTPLSIYTGRGFVMPAVMIDNAVREEIRGIGFSETMRKYKIKYLITPHESPYYMDYAPIFESMKIKEASGRNFNRAIAIHNTIGTPDTTLSRELRRAEEIVKKYNIQDKFVLSDQVGRFKFYSFKN